MFIYEENGIDVRHIEFTKKNEKPMALLFDSFAVNKIHILDYMDVCKTQIGKPRGNYGYIKLIGDSIYWYIKDKLSRLDGPCIITNKEDRVIKRWKINSITYREEGPTTEETIYNSNNDISSIRMSWNNNGVKRYGKHYEFYIKFLSNKVYYTRKSYRFLERDVDIIRQEYKHSNSSSTISYYTYGKYHNFYNESYVTRIERQGDKILSILLNEVTYADERDYDKFIKYET